MKKVLFLSFLVLVAYANSIHNTFVTDDVVSVVRAYPRTFTSLVNENYYFFRHVIYYAIYNLFGLTPEIFRLANIAFHLGSVILAFAIIKKLINPTAAFIAASLFAVHPILVESISWISGGVYPQYSFFFLLSFFLYIKKNIKSSMVFFLFSLASSEKSLSLGLVFVLYNYVFGKKNWKQLISFLAANALAAFFYISFLGYRTSFVTSQTGVAAGLHNPLIQIPVAISTYLTLIIWPHDLSYYHAQTFFSYGEFAWRLSLSVLFFAVTIISFQKAKRIFFWLAFFLIAILPTLTPLKIGSIIAERYLYLGSIGMFVVGAIILEKIPRRISLILLTLILALTTARTITRNVDWKNEEHLWTATIKTSPESANAHYNMGVVHLWHGDREKAKEEFQKAASINPNFRISWEDF